MAQFPLLSLPYVALEHVLKLLCPFELFDLSQCSRKSFAIIRLAGTEQYKLSLQSDRVVVNEKYEFEARTWSYSIMLQGKRRFLLTNGKKIFVSVGCYHGDCSMPFFYFVNSKLGLQDILFHLAELFGCRIDSIHTGPYFPSKIQRSIMERVIEKQKEIRRLTIGNNLTQKDMIWILDNLTITDYFECAVETSLHFKYEFKRYPRFLLIRDSHWFKLDDLLAAAKFCVVIGLLESKLENKDIDVFMKSWASGDFPTLRLLEVRNTDYKVGGGHLNQKDQILGRNPRQWWNNNRAVVQKEIIIDGKFIGLDNGVKFRRDDGIEAKIEMNCGKYENYFRLYVL